MVAGLSLVCLLLGCETGKGTGPSPAAGPGAGTPSVQERIEKHEHFLKNPTRVRAEEAIVVLPSAYFSEITVRGASEGWAEDGEIRVWKGAGACELRVLSLVVFADVLSVSLSPEDAAPEFLLTAQGRVTFAHSVRGVGSSAEDLPFLFLRDDRSLAR